MPPARIPKAKTTKIRTSGYQARWSASSTACATARGSMSFEVFIRSENAERSFVYLGSCRCATVVTAAAEGGCLRESRDAGKETSVWGGSRPAQRRAAATVSNNWLAVNGLGRAVAG